MSSQVRPCRGGSLERPDVPAMSFGGTTPSAYPDRARVRAADREGRSNRSCSEALAAGTMGDRIRIRYFESSFLQVIAVIQERSAHKKRTLRIDDHANIRRLDHDVAIRGTVHEIHFILQSGAAAADHGYAEGSCGPALLFQERIEFARRVLGHFDEP